jgi:hypothetical protein
MAEEAMWNKNYKSFYKGLGITENYNPVVKAFGDGPNLKVYMEELHNENFMNMIKRDSLDNPNFDGIPVSNKDRLKDKLHTLFTFGSSELKEQNKAAVAAAGDTTNSLGALAGASYIDKVVEESIQSMSDTISKIVDSDTVSFDTFE